MPVQCQCSGHPRYVMGCREGSDRAGLGWGIDGEEASPDPHLPPTSRIEYVTPDIPYMIFCTLNFHFPLCNSKTNYECHYTIMVSL